jgi:hypothetical protein
MAVTSGPTGVPHSFRGPQSSPGRLRSEIAMENGGEQSAPAAQECAPVMGDSSHALHIQRLGSLCMLVLFAAARLTTHRQSSLIGAIASCLSLCMTCVPGHWGPRLWAGCSMIGLFSLLEFSLE